VIQPTEDRKHLLGIVGSRDQTGTVTLAFVKDDLTPEKPALIAAPGGNIPAPALDIHELLTMEFPGLADATCDAMGDNFNWVLDEPWQSKLAGKTRFEPTVPGSPGAPLTNTLDLERIQVLDAAAEWYTVSFGLAVLGDQL